MHSTAAGRRRVPSTNVNKKLLSKKLNSTERSCLGGTRGGTSEKLAAPSVANRLEGRMGSR